MITQSGDSHRKSTLVHAWSEYDYGQFRNRKSEDRFIYSESHKDRHTLEDSLDLLMNSPDLAPKAYKVVMDNQEIAVYTQDLPTHNHLQSLVIVSAEKGDPVIVSPVY